MDFKLIAMSERNKIVYLELEAKPVIEEISIKDKMIESVIKSFPEDSDEAKMMKKVIPGLLSAMPDSFESAIMMGHDGGSMMPSSMKPKMTILIDEEQLMQLELKLGDVVRMTLENLRLEKSKSSQKSF